MANSKLDDILTGLNGVSVAPELDREEVEFAKQQVKDLFLELATGLTGADGLIDFRELKKKIEKL